MTVYIDSLFLINAAMDFLLVIITLKITKRSFRLLRVIFSASAGGAFAVCIFFVKFRTVAAAAGFLFPLIILRLAYKPASVKEFVRTVLVFYAAACCMAGVGMMFFLSGKSGGFIKNGIFYVRLSAGMLLISAAGFYMLISAAGYILNRIKKHRIIMLSVTNKSKTVLLSALEDSGNFLKEPITGRPVIIADKDAVYTDGTEALFAVPFHSLGCKNGIIYAFKPDKIICKNCNSQTAEALIGVYDGKLSPDGEYNALIGSRICR